MAPDTLSISKELRAAGFSEEQADVLATQIAAQPEDLVTRQDLALAVAQLERRIDRLDSRIDQVGGELGSRIDQLDEKLDSRIDQLDGKLNSRIDQVEGKLDSRFDQLDGKIDRIESRLVIKLGAIMAGGFALMLTAMGVLAAFLS